MNRAEILRLMVIDTPMEHEVTRIQQEQALKAIKVKSPEMLVEDTTDGVPPLWESEEELWEDLKFCFAPIEANPIALCFVEHLGDIGAPDGSIEAQTIEDGQSWKSENKRNHPFHVATLKDYSEHGWPLNEGNPMRWTTKEEHNEIMRRLSAFGLTMPGSPEALVEHKAVALVESDLTSPEFLIEGLLRKGGAMLVYGPSGIGKSWFTTTLMMLVASGRNASSSALKAGGHQGAHVCLFDGEMLLPDIADRMRVLSAAFGDFDLSAALERISVYSKADTAVGVPFPDLLDRTWHKRIIKHLKESHTDVVVLDNLSTLCPTLDDENSAAAWAPFNDFVVALKREGIAVIVVHHAGKNGGYRGSSNLVTTLETVVALRPTEGSTEQTGACFTVNIEKARNSAPIEIKGKTLRLVNGQWVTEVDEGNMVSRVVALIRSLNYTNQTEVGRALGVEQYVVARVIQRAIKMGLLGEHEAKQKFADAKELQEERDQVPLDV